MESVDIRIAREITTYKIKVYTYMDDINCTIEHITMPQPCSKRQPKAIIVARKARNIVSEELELNGWFRDPDKNKEINFGI